MMRGIGIKGLHEIEIEPASHCDITAIVKIDGKDISEEIMGYTLRHSDYTVPEISINVRCKTPKYKLYGKISISNLERIAAVMSKAQFNEFCRIWREIHGREKDV